MTDNRTPAPLGEATFDIHVWVAGASGQHAYERLQIVEEFLAGFANHTGGGCGWPSYQRWSTRSRANPLDGQGEYISDATYRKTEQVSSPDAAAVLALELQTFIAGAARFPVAVEVDLARYVPPQNAASTGSAPAPAPDPNRRILVLMTEQEHAILLACLRRTARKGGLESTAEADIATNGYQWPVPSPDMIDGVGDHLVLDAVVARDVRL